MAFENFKAAPLSSGFMFTSIIGFFVTVYFWNLLGDTFGFTFVLFFVLLFIASMISMSHADPDDILALEDRRRKRI